MMSNLQPLEWVDTEHSVGLAPNIGAQGAGIFYRIAKVGDKAAVTWHDQSEGSTGAKELGSVCEAKHWIETDHYPSKMQPYVKPSPTWIDVEKRLPESERFYLVRLFDGHRDDYVTVILWWNSEHKQFLEWDAMCEPTHWMPIPEFSKQGE